MSRNQKRGRRIRQLIAAVILIPVVFFAGMLTFLLISEGRTAVAVGDETYDAIIVLGAQVKQTGEPSVQLEWRLNAAADAYRNRPVPVVVCGAQGKDEPEPEAYTMKRYLAAQGIPEEDILVDPDSFNTKQNIRNAGKLLNLQDGTVRRVLVVTSDYHVPRSLAIARDAGMEAIGLGSPCKPEYWIKNHFRETLAWVKYLGGKILHIGQE